MFRPVLGNAKEKVVNFLRTGLLKQPGRLGKIVSALHKHLHSFRTITLRMVKSYEASFTRLRFLSTIETLALRIARFTLEVSLKSV